MADWATDRQITRWMRLRLVTIPYSPMTKSQITTPKARTLTGRSL